MNRVSRRGSLQVAAAGIFMVYDGTSKRRSDERQQNGGETIGLE